MIGGRILDTSALEHIATGRSIYARALVWAAVEQNTVLVVPTTTLTTAWARIPIQDHPVLEVLPGLPNTVLDILNGPLSRPPVLGYPPSQSPFPVTRTKWGRMRTSWFSPVSLPTSAGSGPLSVIELAPLVMRRAGRACGAGRTWLGRTFAF